jgi:4,5-DOPA dioxygenase extradiol
MQRFPACFVSHGAPTAALDDDAYTRALAAFAQAQPAPRAVVVVSAHWEAHGPVRVNAVARPPLIYDFGGFPDALYRLSYPAPGAPDLAAEVTALLQAAGIDTAQEASRGWDHGVWVPLRLMYPAAAVPVVEVSLPVPRTPARIMAMGAALAPLRDRGVLLFGSGGIVHNLRRLRFGEKQPPVDDWAVAFDEWVRTRLEQLDAAGLAGYRDSAPHAALAAPTTEHFDPLFFVLGARADADRIAPIFEGFEYGSLSMRSFALG